MNTINTAFLSSQYDDIEIVHDDDMNMPENQSLVNKCPGLGSPPLSPGFPDISPVSALCFYDPPALAVPPTSPSSPLVPLDFEGSESPSSSSQASWLQLLIESLEPFLNR